MVKKILEFPRPKRRGSVEAPQKGPSFPAEATFPRPKRRGSVEARGRPPSTQSPPAFPRPKRRGSVEALIEYEGEEPEWYFRAQKGAAPLKPRKGQRWHVWDVEFPRPKRRGSVEAMT